MGGGESEGGGGAGRKGDFGRRGWLVGGALVFGRGGGSEGKKNMK